MSPTYSVCRGNRYRYYDCDPNHVALGVAKPAEIDGDGLCVSEEEGGTRQEEQAWQNDPAKRIDMLEWIEGHAPKRSDGVVAKMRATSPAPPHGA
jgi:hypothetical protein